MDSEKLKQLLKTLRRAGTDIRKSVLGNQELLGTELTFHFPENPPSYWDLKNDYEPSYLNTTIRKSYLKYYKAIQRGGVSLIEYDTIFEAISTSLCGEPSQGDLLELHCLKAVAISDLENSITSELLKGLAKFETDGLHSDIVIETIADILGIRIAVWGQDAYDGKVKFHGTQVQVGETAKKCAGLVIVNRRCTAVVQCGELPLDCAGTITGEAIPSSPLRGLDNDKADFFVPVEAVKTSLVTMFGVTAHQIHPVQLSEKGLKDPCKEYSKYRKVLKKFGIALCRPSKRVWQKCKPTFKDVRKVNHVDFSKQTFKLEKKNRNVASTGNPATGFSMNLGHFLDEDEKQPFDYTKPLLEGLNDQKNVLYSIGETCKLISHFNNGFDLEKITCEGFSKCFIAIKLPGVINIYYYIGTKWSRFQIHREDNNFASFNLLLFGCYKIWIAIPRHETGKVEKLILEQLQAADKEFAKITICQNFIQHKSLILCPKWLQQEGIEFYFVRQRPGDLVYTDTGALHFGVNAGFNLAAAMNLMDEDWINQYHTQSVCNMKSCGGGSEPIINGERLFQFFEFCQPGEWSSHLPETMEQDPPEHIWLEDDITFEDESDDSVENIESSNVPAPSSPIPSTSTHVSSSNPRKRAREQTGSSESSDETDEEEEQVLTSSSAIVPKKKRNRPSLHFEKLSNGQYVCLTCRKVKGSRAKVSEHSKAEHFNNPTPAPERVSCLSCPRSFSKKGNLTAHLKKGCPGLKKKGTKE